jgi:hypothetical protein
VVRLIDGLKGILSRKRFLSFLTNFFMTNFAQFSALSETEVVAINGGGPLDGALTGVNNLLTGLGNALTGVGGVTTGLGNALTLAGAGAGSTLNQAGLGVNTLLTGLAGLLNGINLPTI